MIFMGSWGQLFCACPADEKNIAVPARANPMYLLIIPISLGGAEITYIFGKANCSYCLLAVYLVRCLLINTAYCLSILIRVNTRGERNGDYSTPYYRRPHLFLRQRSNPLAARPSHCSQHNGHTYALGLKTNFYRAWCLA